MTAIGRLKRKEVPLVVGVAIVGNGNGNGNGYGNGSDGLVAEMDSLDAP
jgi:hypothetical protein